MRFFITLFAGLAMTVSISAQSLSKAQSNPKNSLQFWAGGAGLAYSIGYERILIDMQNIKIAGEAGLALYPASTGIIGAWIPVHLNLIFFERAHHLEIGSGIVLTDEFFRQELAQNIDSDYFANIRLGYRYQHPDSRFMFRAAFTPFFEMRRFGDSEHIKVDMSKYLSNILPWGGIALGYSF